MSQPELPIDPFVPVLPQVSQEAIKIFSEAWKGNPSLITESYSRLAAEQPDLIGAVAIKALDGARDEAEASHSIQTAILMYLLMESQQQVDSPDLGI